MKTNITRLISITLAVLMVVCSFSACKKKTENNDDTSTLSTVEVSVDPGSTNYFTIDENRNDGCFHKATLDAMPAVEETEHVRVVRFEKGLRIMMDGKKGEGVVVAI